MPDFKMASLGMQGVGLANSLVGGEDEEGGGESQTSSSAPWKELHPYLLGGKDKDGNPIPGIYPEAVKQYQNFSGSNKVAPIDDATRFGYGIGLSNAMQQGQAGETYANAALGMLPQFQQGLNFGLNGAMDVFNNPAVMQQINALNSQADAQRNIMRTKADESAQNLVQDYSRQFNESTMPGLRSSAIGAGQYGSNRDAIASSLAQSRNQESLDRQLGNLSEGVTNADAMLQAQQQGQVSSLLGNAYNTGMNTFNQSLGLAPRTIGSFSEMGTGMMSPAPQTLMSLGNFNRDYSQDQLDAQFKNSNLGWENLQNYAGILGGGMSGGFGERSQQQPEMYSNPLGQALGIGSGIYGIGKNQGWWGGSSGGGSGGTWGGGDSFNYGAAQPNLGPSW